MANQTTRKITPHWQQPTAHVAQYSTAAFGLEWDRGPLLADTDLYDAVLRTSAARTLYFAESILQKEHERTPHMSRILLREAALLLDLLVDRHRARDQARAEQARPARKSRKRKAPKGRA